MENFLGDHMVFRGERSEDQSLPTEYKAGTIGN